MPDRGGELAAWFLRHVPGAPSEAGAGNAKAERKLPSGRAVQQVKMARSVSGAPDPCPAPISGLRFPHVVGVARTNREHLGHI